MQTISVKPRLMTTEEASEFLGCSPGTLAVWRCTARYPLPYVRIGRNIRYQESDLLAWMESRKVHAAEVGQS